MSERLIEMLGILVVYPALLAAVQTLTIDSQLSTSVEDCFDRISIGEKFPSNSIYRNISELTTRECEEICKHDKQCQAYGYGVGAKGNASCDLSRLDEKQLRPNLVRHPDFDVFVRRVQCEQTPPLPIQPALYDAGEGNGSGEGNSQDQGPIHRPIHRPEVEDPKTPSSDHQLTDLRPNEANQHTSPHKLYHGNRPADLPPSYGAFMPQDIPFKPEYGSFQPQIGSYRPQFGYYRPQNAYVQPPNYIDNYRPDKPDYIHTSDILYFQEHRPLYADNYRPDPYYPPLQINEVTDPYSQNARPQESYRPERPGQYMRPIKRPQLHETDSYYYKPQRYPVKPELTGSTGPTKPHYIPNRPSYLDRPPNHHDKYDNFYGQNHQGSSNNIGSIENPASNRPRPTYSSNGHYEGLTGYGYGPEHYSNQNVQKPHTSHSQYGFGTITEIDNDNNVYRPQGPSNRPQRPENEHPGNNHNQYQIGGNTSSTSKPGNGYSNPSNNYGSNQSHGSYVPPQNSYHGAQSESGYGSNQPSHGLGSKPPYENQPLYGESKPPFTAPERPVYGNNRPSPNRPFHDTDRPYPSYGNKPFNDDDNNPHQSGASGYNNGVEDNKKTANWKRNHNSSLHGEVKPVYEFERYRPANVPHYVARPDGEVVTSRPVVVGDYGGQPLQRGPGLGPSFRDECLVCQMRQLDRKW